MRAYTFALIGIVLLTAGIVIGFTPHQPIVSSWVTAFLTTFLIIYGLILAGVGLVDLNPPIEEHTAINWPGFGIVMFYVMVASAGLVTLWFAVKAIVLWLIGLI